MLGIFENAHKKVVDRQKHHFGRFWRLITVFLCIFRNTDKNNICGSIVFKAKIKEKYEEIFFLKGFCFKTYKSAFLGVKFFFGILFFSALALKTIDTQMLFCLPFCTGAAKVEDGTRLKNSKNKCKYALDSKTNFNKCLFC